METRREIGQWVFSLKNCPKDATAVVVNRDGTFAWWRGSHPEAIQAVKKYGWWIANPPAVGRFQSEDTGLLLSAEDWDISLTIKEELKNKASDYAIIMAN